MTTATELNRRLAAGEPVVHFDGPVHCTEPLHFGPYRGQRLVGTGPSARLFFHFDGDGEGPACINLGGHFQGIQSCEIRLKPQSTASSRADAAPRPTAIDLHGYTRATLSDLTVHNATDGLKALGNCGGLTLTDVQIGAIGTAFHIDGARDTVTMTRCRVWPFGHVNTPNGLAIYSDGASIGARFGRVDDLSITTMTTFRASVQFQADAEGIAAFGHIANLRLDGSYANLTFEAGDIAIGFLGSTSEADDDFVVRQTGGQLVVTKSDLELPSSTHPGIGHFGGHGTYHGGHILVGSSIGARAVRQDGGRLVMRGMEFPTHPELARETPIIEIREGAFYGSDLLAGLRTTGSGTFFLARRKARGSINDSDSGGWGWELRGRGLRARGNVGSADAPDDVLTRIRALESLAGIGTHTG
ncbi:MAG: hypothetical protein AAGF49_04335 [Pseudomonadota bacterium]